MWKSSRHGSSCASSSQWPGFRAGRCDAPTAAQKARDECGCGCCATMDTLSGIDLD
ncbi:hypothetical protein SEA_EMSQUAREDA_78 [Gordonia phage EMsquaredA]|nr:hypothetical protein SEA_EMSQUAREDA_78 [Gordonia phage EMsquaredA]